MNIGFTILSINDWRLANKDDIRAKMPLPEHFIDCVNGVNTVETSLALKQFDISVDTAWKNIKAGELGVWLTHLRLWQYIVNTETDIMIVFEDDALVDQTCFHKSLSWVEELGDIEWDAFQICPPSNQFGDYRSRVVYDQFGIPKQTVRYGEKKYKFDVGLPTVCRAYTGYCCVAWMYTRQGAEKLLQYALEDGIRNPVDCWILEQAHSARSFEAYSPKPEYASAVKIDWQTPTTIQNTERVNDAV